MAISCVLIRRWYTERHTLKFNTDEISPAGPGEWVEGPCGHPLFGGDETKNGVCRSCAERWQCDRNFPVDPNGQRIEPRCFAFDVLCKDRPASQCSCKACQHYKTEVASGRINTTGAT
jgi:hypothetical protein